MIATSSASSQLGISSCARRAVDSPLTRPAARRRSRAGCAPDPGRKWHKRAAAGWESASGREPGRFRASSAHAPMRAAVGLDEDRPRGVARDGRLRREEVRREAASVAALPTWDPPSDVPGFVDHRAADRGRDVSPSQLLDLTSTDRMQSAARLHHGCHVKRSASSNS